MKEPPFILNRVPVGHLREPAPSRVPLRAVLLFCLLAFGLGVLLGAILR